MNKEQTNWAKTTILSYKHLGVICDAIDKLVETIATKSFYTSTKFLEINSIHSVSKRIIALTDKKIDYINLKVLIEKIFTKLKPNRAKVLVLKYIHNISVEKIQEVLNISYRSCYRALKMGIEDFASLMIKFGYTNEKMEVLFNGDEFLNSIYKSITTERCYKCDDIDNINVNPIGYISLIAKQIN